LVSGWVVKDAIFDVVDVTKVYAARQQPANDHVTLTINRGEIFGILGDNGAGKSTLIQQLAGLVAPTAGVVRFLGADVAAAGRELTANVGYMPQTAFALNNLTAREAIFFTARFRGLSRAEARAEAARMLGQWGIEPIKDRVAKQMSGGQRRLLQLAVAMTASPPVLILDEPTNDLDPVNRRRVWEHVRLAQNAGATVIFVTHDAVEAGKVVSRVAIMRGGRIAALGRPAELKGQLSNQFRLELTGPADRPPILPAWIRCSQLEPGRWLAVIDKADVGTVLADLDVNDYDDVRLSSATLEDLYLHYAA
jgi:ABC-2 type transport system ATP-binding protein